MKELTVQEIIILIIALGHYEHINNTSAIELGKKLIDMKNERE